MTMLDEALRLARSGLFVFALKPREKVPAMPNGCKDASPNEQTVTAMWVNPKRNIGIATGGASGVVVLDVDGEEGRRTLDMWTATLGPLPATPTVTTARGLHFYFRYPEQAVIRNSASKAGPGIDVRSDGGYVVAPPSIHPDGDVYRWADGASIFDLPLADMPEWLLQKLVDKPPMRHQEASYTPTGYEHTRYGQRALDAECMALSRAPEGGRNDALNRLAFRVGQLVVAGHLQESAAVAEVSRVAGMIGLTRSETEKTIASGLSAGKKEPNPSDPDPNDRAARAARNAPRDDEADGEAPSADVPAAAKKPESKDVEILTAEQVTLSAFKQLTDPSRAALANTGFSRLDDAIGGYPPGTMHVVGGRTGAGKSSLLLETALRMSRKNKKTGIVSCEDAEWVWGARVLASLRGIDPDQFFASPPSRESVIAAMAGVEDARSIGVHFAFTIGKPVSFITAAIRRLVAEGCELIEVDYLQAIATKGQDRYIAHTDATQEIKGLCHDLGVPLVLASQLKRPTEGNPFREPHMGDLKNSGDIENMAESIVLLWPTSDEERAPVIGKVAKVKWSPKRPRFMLERHPTSGALVSLVDAPKEATDKPRRRTGGFMPEYRED